MKTKNEKLSFQIKAKAKRKVRSIKSECILTDSDKQGLNDVAHNISLLADQLPRLRKSKTF